MKPFLIKLIACGILYGLGIAGTHYCHMPEDNFLEKEAQNLLFNDYRAATEDAVEELKQK